MNKDFSKMKKMLDRFQDIQQHLETMEITGSAGGGLVRVTLSGTKNLKKIEIQKECVNPEDIEGLQDLILAAFHQASQTLEQNKHIGESFNSFLD